MLPRAGLTEAIGWLSERPIPLPLRAPMLGGLARAFGIDMEEAERPARAYSTFQQLFCRRLSAGARTCDASEDAVVSPVDGRVLEWGTVSREAVFEVKGRRYSALTLLGGEGALAERFLGGSFCILYLSPRDYHRMHSPVSGQVIGYRWLCGEYWPVNGLVPFLPDVYCENERVVTLIRAFGGLVAMVKIAALGVGYISLAYLGEEAGVRLAPGGRPRARDFDPSEAPAVRCGEEIAAFGLGSTVVLLFEPGGVRLTLPPGGSQVRVGMPMGEQVPR
jgi:phosphatidylserine decarboxylase